MAKFTLTPEQMMKGCDEIEKAISVYYEDKKDRNRMLGILLSIKKQAEKNDLASLLGDGGLKKPEAVTLKGKVVSFESMANGKKTYLVVVPDGYKGKTEVDVQTGSIYTGTAVRDVQNEKKFEDFTNQTEWSEYAKSLNAEVDSNVIAALDFAKNDPTGKTVTLTGAAESTAGKVVVTPVEMTVE